MRTPEGTANKAQGGRRHLEAEERAGGDAA